MSKYEDQGPVVSLTTSRFEELSQRSAFLAALEANGVDNWEGYEAAQELFERYNEGDNV